MQVAALVTQNKIVFYNYTGRIPPYSGILEQPLPIIECDVLRNLDKDTTAFMVPLHGEGLLEVTIPRQSDHLFAGVSKELLISYMIAVYRGRKQKRPDYELKLLSLPCFIEDGIVFSLTDVQIRNQVKTMR